MPGGRAPVLSVFVPLSVTTIDGRMDGRALEEKKRSGNRLYPFIRLRPPPAAGPLVRTAPRRRPVVDTYDAHSSSPPTRTTTPRVLVRAEYRRRGVCPGMCTYVVPTVYVYIILRPTTRPFVSTLPRTILTKRTVVS